METEDFLSRSGLTVTMLLCDSAQVAGGKLFVLGGGLAVVGPKPQPLGLALYISVPWDRADVSHSWRVTLNDEDGRPVVINDKAVVLEGKLRVRRPSGVQPGTPLGVPLAINLSPFPIAVGRSYTFALSIDDESHPDWRVRFFVRKPKAS